MDERGSRTLLEWTDDHLMPVWMRRERLYELTFGELQATVPCCWHCNQLKGEMSPGQWQAFMEANPRWWLKFPRVRGAPAKKRRRLPGQHPWVIGRSLP